MPPPIACCAGTAELHGAGQGSATEALSRSGRETTSFHSNPGADGVLFRLVRRHPRAPGGASQASTLPLAAPEPPTSARDQGQAVFRFVHRLPRRLHRPLRRLQIRRGAPTHPGSPGQIAVKMSVASAPHRKGMHASHVAQGAITSGWNPVAPTR